MEAALWIFGILIFVAIAKSEGEKTERMSWSDEKLEARKDYVRWHKPNSDEWMKIDEEQDRRIEERLKAEAKERWSKYE
jgi:hypothetical protein